MPPGQLNLSAVDASPTFGRRVRTKLEQLAKEKGKLTFTDIERTIDEMHASQPRAAQVRKRDARDRLLRELVTACGITPDSLTDEAARVAAINLADILRHCPNADAAEFERRVRCYRRKYSGAAVTPRALNVHWHEFPPPPPVKADSYTAPEAWEEKLALLAEIEGLDLGRLKEFAGGGWLNVPIYIREMIVKLP